jgi:hypothetical protein
VNTTGLICPAVAKKVTEVMAQPLVQTPSIETKNSSFLDVLKAKIKAFNLRFHKQCSDTDFCVL